MARDAVWEWNLKLGGRAQPSLSDENSSPQSLLPQDRTPRQHSAPIHPSHGNPILHLQILKPIGRQARTVSDQLIVFRRALYVVSLTRVHLRELTETQECTDATAKSLILPVENAQLIQSSGRIPCRTTRHSSRCVDIGNVYVCMHLESCPVTYPELGQQLCTLCGSRGSTLATCTTSER